MFKNALCLAMRPDAYGYKQGEWSQVCKRRANHEGPHRTLGRYWNDGDSESLNGWEWARRQRAIEAEGKEDQDDDRT